MGLPGRSPGRYTNYGAMEVSFDAGGLRTSSFSLEGLGDWISVIDFSQSRIDGISGDIPMAADPVRCRIHAFPPPFRFLSRYSFSFHLLRRMVIDITPWGMTGIPGIPILRV